MARFNLKRVVKKVLYCTCLPYLIIRLLYFVVSSFRSTPGTVILCYHSINDINNSHIFKPNIVDTAKFLQQIQFLKKYYNVVSLNYFLKHYEALTHSKNVVITFDDGYKDNFSIAYPVLRKYKIPATIFLATDFINTGKAKFEDTLAYCFSTSNIATIDLHSLDLRTTLTTENEKEAIVAQICYTLNKLDSKKRKEVISELCNKYNIGPDCLNEMKNIMLTWAEIKHMDSQLISFGSHSLSHQNLTKLSHIQQIDEVVKSKSIIEHQLNSLVAGFSYPLGVFNSDVIKIVKDANYTYAITTIPGVNNGDMDVFKLKRVSAVNNFHLFKMRLICQKGKLYNIYSKLVRLLV